jgi:hypothetical protein
MGQLAKQAEELEKGNAKEEELSHIDEQINQLKNQTISFSVKNCLIRAAQTQK